MSAPADYQGFPIADLRKGIEIQQEPWLGHPSGWQLLENLYLYRGRLYRRPGYGVFGHLGYQVTNEAEGGSLGKGTAGNPKVFAMTNEPVVPGTIVIEDTALHIGVNAVTDTNGDGDLFSNGVSVGAYDYDLNIGVINGLAAGFDAASLTIDYRYRRLTVASGTDTKNMVMLLTSYFDSSQVESNLAFDRMNSFLYNAATELYDRKNVNDLWTGEPSDVMWPWIYDSKTLILNGKDPIAYFDGTNIKEVHTDWTNPATARPDLDRALGGGDTDPWDPVPPLTYSRKIDTARAGVRFKNRFVIFAPTEGGVYYPRHARWTKVNPTFTAGDDWAPLDYKPCDAKGEFITGYLITPDEFVAFFSDSVWRLRWRDDFRDPFEWVLISNFEDGAARMGITVLEKEIVAVGKTNLVGSDGRQAYEVGETIPDFQKSWNQGAVDQSHGLVAKEFKQGWLSFPTTASDYPDRVLVNQYRESAFSVYTLPMQCFGLFKIETDPTLDDIDEAWDDTSFAWDDRFNSAGYPLILLGGRDCIVYKFGSSGSDNGSPVAFTALSNKLNPYASQGVWARERLGWIDILGEAVGPTSIRVEVFVDFDTAPMFSKDVDLAPPAGTDRVIARVPLDPPLQARWVQIRLSGSLTVDFAIDAIVPHFHDDGMFRPDFQS